MHLPKHDDTVVLVDESEQEFETKYLVDKNGLSGGWRGFSIAHKLLEKDVLVFQLIAPCKFKVMVKSPFFIHSCITSFYVLPNTWSKYWYVTLQ